MEVLDKTLLRTQDAKSNGWLQVCQSRRVPGSEPSSLSSVRQSLEAFSGGESSALLLGAVCLGSVSFWRFPSLTSRVLHQHYHHSAYVVIYPSAVPSSREAAFPSRLLSQTYQEVKNLLVPAPQSSFPNTAKLRLAAHTQARAALPGKVFGDTVALTRE